MDKESSLIRSVEVFMAVAEMRHVTGAAKALGMTQSAASQHLCNLEQGFGVTLVDRSKRPIQLTHAGEMLQRHGYRILNEIEDLKSSLRHLKSEALPALRVGLLASIATSLTPALFSLVVGRLGVPELILSAGLASDHQAAFGLRQIDIAVTSENYFDRGDYQSFPVLEEPFMLILPESYQGPTDDLEKIASTLSLVRFGSSTPVGRRTDQHLRRCRLNLQRAMEADRASMVVAGVATGKCFALLTPTLLIDAVAEGMPLKAEKLPIPGFTRSIQVVYREDSLKLVAHMIAEECTSVLNRQFEERFPDLACRMRSSGETPEPPAAETSG